MTTKISEVTSQSTRIRLEYLDGLRGLAAFYVLLFHAYGEVVWSYSPALISPTALRLSSCLNFGHYSVVIFIVLSGYCLMLPVVRSGTNEIGSFSSYIKRRSRRILPPYYAALILSLLVIACVPGLREMNHVRWDSALPALTPGAIISHLLLLHNLSPDWIYKINNPMWSVATEWQIYFAFPFLLLPVWKRFGNVVPVIFGLILGFALYKLSHSTLGMACPWFLGVFAMGMAAAAVNFPFQTHKGAPSQIPWNAIGFSLIGVIVGIHVLLPKLVDYGIVMDAILGTATACLLISCTQWLQKPSGPSDSKAKPALLRVLESKLATQLGTFSYSLYLTHFVTLGCLHLILRTFKVSPTNCLLILLSFGVLLSIAIGYGFYLVFERPFMPGHPRSQKATVIAAVVSPAP